MGLSQRKEKQRIGYDPRNLSWSGDKERFSYKHMKALGWTDSSGIGGSDLTGNAKHIAVVHKLDSSGIGMARAMKEGDEMGGQARAGLEDVLKRLASASASASASTSLEGSPVPDVKPGEERQKIRNRIASRQRHLQSKRLASSSPAALAEILGIAPSALPSPDTVTVKIEPGTLPLADIKPVINPSTPVREAEDVVSTSTLSVSDYFRQKMRAKALARHAADGTAPPPEPILPSASSPKPVTEWEGTKVAFTETEAVPLSFTENADDLAEPTRAEGETKEAKKAAKKARKAEKEAKRALKAEKKAKKEAQVGKESNEGDQGKKKKRKRDTE